MSALLAAAALALFGARAADPWADLVATRAPRRAVLAKLGPEASHFVSGFDAGSYPLQLLSSPPEPGTATETASRQTVVEVLEYPSGERGFHYQLAVHDGKALYAVAPPLESEKDPASIARRYGPVSPAAQAVVTADIVRTWKVLSYPARKRLFVLAPDGKSVLARVVLP